MDAAQMQQMQMQQMQQMMQQQQATNMAGMQVPGMQFQMPAVGYGGLPLGEYGLQVYPLELPLPRGGTWTPEEDMILVAAHRTYGNRWAQIAKLLPGRTDNGIKNRWNTTLRRRLRPDGSIKRKHD